MPKCSARVSGGGLWDRVVYSRMMKGLTKQNGGSDSDKRRIGDVCRLRDE